MAESTKTAMAANPDIYHRPSGDLPMADLRAIRVAIAWRIHIHIREGVEYNISDELGEIIRDLKV